MEIIREKFKELLQQQFLGNYNKCSMTLGLDSAHIHRYVNKGEGGGKKIIGVLMRYCRENDLDYNEYIRL